VRVGQELFVFEAREVSAAAQSKESTPKPAAGTPPPPPPVVKEQPAKAAEEKPNVSQGTPPPPPKASAPPATVVPSKEPEIKLGSREERRVKMSKIRQRISTRLKESQNTAAMLTTFQEIDMHNIIELRNKFKDAFEKKHTVKLGFMSAFVRASSIALKDNPIANAVIDGDNIIYRDYHDISVAVATPNGLIVPVLRNVENMSFATIEKTINELARKGKDNQLAIEDMSGGTFTISNGGVYGSFFGTPIINPPQSAILGMHAINKRAHVVGEEIKIRPIMFVALTYDHRLLDGRDAVLFLRKIKSCIEEPESMLLDL